MVARTHEVIVRRFCAGETALAISASLGYTAKYVRTILRREHVGDLRRGARRRTFEFESRADGEYCKCTACERKGYGVDSWHPATAEFWRTREGRLYFNQCTACLSEMSEGKKGIVRIAA